MSSTIDNKVVEIRFDNQQFEKGVSTTMSTLDKLKRSLKFEGATKGLESVSTAANKLDFGKIENTACRAGFHIQDVWLKLSTVFEYQVARRIMNAAANMTKALTIDPVKTGFQEYETQINSVQTILANTESKGTTLEQVNRALDELNTYADKTIYNFTQMTRNIGTFTAAGVDLNTSVAAIKGIANLAAVSGSTSQQASTAMYQLSQALASGTVKLMDWNSVVNAGMGGQVFQDALKETARLHGIAIDQMIKDEGSFRETLSNGWLSSTILTETLAKFTGDLTEAQLKNMGYTEEQIAGILKLGKTANDAATKVKTFTQLFDTLKESAQSGWSQTWKILVGDFEESKKLFTEISDAFGKVIGGISDARNNLLKGAFSSKWSQLEEQLTNAGVPFDDFQKKLIETAKSHGIAIDKMIEKEGSLEKTIKHGWLTSGMISETLRGYTSEISATNAELATIMESLAQFGDVVDQVIVGNFGNGEQRIRLLTEAGYDYATIQDLVNKTLDGTVDNLEKLSAEQLKNLGFTEEQIGAIQLLAEEADKSGTSINKLITDLTKPSGRELLIDTFRNALKGLGKVLGSIRDAWRATFSPLTSDQVYRVVEAIHSLSQRLILNREDANKLTRTFKGLFAILDVITTFTGGALKTALKLIAKLFGLVDMPVLDLTAHIGDLLVGFRDWLFTNSIFAKVFDRLIDVIVSGATKVKDWFVQFKSLPGLEARIEKLKAVFVKTFNAFTKILQNGVGLLKNFSARIVDATKKVKQWVDEFKSIPAVQSALNKFKTGVSNVLTAIRKAFAACKKPFENFFERIKSLETLTFEDVISAVKDLAKQVINNFSKIGASFKSIPQALNDLAFEVKIKLGKTWKGFDEFLTRISYFAKSVRDRIGGIDLGGIILAALGIGTLTVGSKIGDALEALTAPLSGFGELLKGLATQTREVSGLLKAVKFTVLASGFVALATGIILLAGAVALLTLVDQKKLWSAVGAMAVLGGVLAALAAAMAAINKGITNVIANTKSIIMLAGAVLMLAVALAVIAKIDTKKLVGGLVVLTGLMGALVAVSIVLSKQTPQLFAGAASLIAFAVAVKILASALKDITKMKGSKLAEDMVVLVGIMAGLALVTKLCGTVDWKGVLATVAAALAIKILIKVLDQLTKVNLSTITEALGSFVVIVGMISAIMLATKLAGNNAAKAGVAILAISLALVLMGTVLKQLSKIDAKSLLAPVAVIGALMALIAGVIASTALAGQNAVKAGAMLLMMAGAITLLAVIIAVLSKLDPSGLGRGVAAIAALEACFAGLIAVTRFAAPFKKVKGVLISMIAMIGLLSVALVALSMMDESNVLAASASIIAVLGTIALLLKSVGNLKGVNGKTLATLGVVTGIVAALGGILYLLGDMEPETALAVSASLSLLLITLAGVCKILDAIPKASGGGLIAVGLLTVIVAGLGGILYLLRDLEPESTLTTAVSLSALILALSGACAILTVAGTAAGSALAGVGVLAALIVALGALMAGIGALVTEFPQIGQWLDTAIPVLDKIGYGLGSFVGSIIGGFSAGALSGLPAIATSISQFMTNLKPFVDGIKAVDADMLSAAKNIVEIVLLMTAANLVNSIGSFLIGGRDISDFSKQLVALGAGIVGFSKIVDGNVSASAVEAAAGAGKMLTELATSVPNSGGLLGFIVGENDIDDFAKKLPVLATGLVAFSKIVDGNVSKDSVEIAKDAGKMLTELASTVPNSGGLLGFIVGENDIDDFAKKLPVLATGLVAFSKIVDGKVSKDSVETAKEAGKMLTELADTVPNSGGLLGFIVGDNDIATFASRLPILATGIVAFSKIVEGNINKDDVEIAASAGEMLTKLADTVPNSGGLLEFLVGGNDIAMFATQLPILATGIVAFSKIVEGNVNKTAVQTAKDSGELIVELANTVPNTGGLFSFISGKADAIPIFASQLPTLAAGIVAFSKIVEGNVDKDDVTTATDAGELLVELSNSVPKSGGLFEFFTGKKDIDGFVISLPKLAAGIVAFSKIVTGKDGGCKVDTDAVTAATNAGELISTLHSNVSENTGTWLHNLFGGDNANFKNFKKQMPLLGEAIVEFSEAISGKIDAGAVTAAETVSEVLAVLMERMSAADVKQIGNFNTNLEKLGTAILEFYEDLITLNLTTLKNTMSVLNDMVDDLASWTNSVDTTELRTYGTTLATIGDKVKDIYQDLISIKIDKFRAALNIVDELVHLTMDMTEVDASGINAFGASLSKLGSTGVGRFVKAFEDAEKDIQDAATGMMTTFSDSISNTTTVDKATTAFGKVVTAILEVVTGTSKNSAGVKNRDRFKAAGVTVISAFGSGISGKDSINGTGLSIGTVIKAAIDKLRHKDTRTEFNDAGVYLVEGFANGIASDIARRKAESAARSMVRNTINAINAEAQIHSPSKVTYESGEYMGMGLVNALSDYADKSYDAGANLAESARVGLRKAIAKVVDSLNGDLDTDPVIRPVLDLTNVESGARRLNTMFARTQVMSIDIGNRHTSDDDQNGDTVGSKHGNTYQFTQNNYSPKALSRIDIYRQTKNQFSAMERMVEDHA